MKTIRLKLNQPSDPGWTPSTVKRRRHRGAEASPVIASLMNRRCAAGTGAFIEEQSLRLRVDISGIR